jgi:hemerythrin-like domain-containing protein
MKRHESMVALSREHHFGLLFCWKIRQGVKKQVPTERMQSYVQYFWDNHLQQHFEEEERLLFATLQDSLCDQAISEHNNIRKLVEAVNSITPVPPNELTLLVDSIDNHIRFEERTLFPHIEKVLPEEVLTDIGIRLKLLHEGHPKDMYADEFWV